MSNLTKRITAMLLSGMLVIGSVPGSVLAASTDVDPGQTSEIAEEVFTEGTSEEPASGGETSEIEDTSEAPAAAGENYSEETSAEEAAVQYYTVTLDANGGYFENEWDDAIEDYAQQVEVVEKHIPVDGAVAAFPVFNDPDGQAMLFAGWSLERDGELVSKAEEEYIPVDNRVLYAVWRAEDAALVETEEQEVADEGTEQADSVQKSEEFYAAEESADAVTSEENPVEEEVVTEFTEDTSDVPVDAGNMSQVENTSEAPAAIGETAEEASAEEEAQYYTVTLDANGGYFENEWDDAIGDYAQQAEVVEKHIPVDGTVTAFPIFTDPDGQTMVFAGWSLERDGELVITGDEEYAPVDNCVLYAVWEAAEAEDAALAETGEQEEADEENSEQADAAQESEEVDAASRDAATAEEGTVAEDTASEANTDPETESEQTVAPSQEAVSADEDVENISEESSDAAEAEGETQPELTDLSKEEETVREDAAKGVVESGTFGANGDNLTWTLDEEGTLTISGMGKMEDFSESNVPWTLNRAEIKKVEIKNGVTSIGVYAFSSCESLKSVTIPDSVTKIWNMAFKNCRSLESIILPNSLTSIELGIFLYCTSLKNVTIPNSVTMINGSAFYGCTSLESITIPSSIRTIYSQAFLGCTSLESIFFNGNALNINLDVFKNVTATAYYPANDSTWTEDERKNYGGNITWAPWDPVTGIIYGTSGICGDNLTWTLDEEGTLTISGTGGMEDYQCTFNGSTTICTYPWLADKIKNIIINFGVTNIGENSFRLCKNLRNVNLPNSIMSIKDCAFYGSNNLTTVNIPNSVTNIGHVAFSGCTSLNNITISNSVTNIGVDAFYGCTSLSSIYFNGNAPSISSTAFTDVTATAYYPANDPTWTEDVRQNYGGNITWETWDPGVDGGSIINATFPKNGEIGVDPSLLTDFNIYVEFKYPISVTGNGCLYLKNQLTDEIVQTIPLTDDNYGDGYIITGNKLFLSISEKVYAGEKYYVEIDQNSLKFGVIDESTGEWKDIDTIFSGLGRNDWNFTIINFAYPNFQNHEFNIDRVLYSYLFAPLYDEFIRRIDDGSKGLCYGMSYASQAWNHKWKGVLAATGGNSIEKIPEDAVYSGLSFLQYIELVHLSQYIPSEPIECSLNANKYQKIYEAVCSSINGTGEMVMLGVDGTPGNHAILPVAILSDTDEKAEIIVYDSNCPPANKKDGERVLYLHTYLPILTFTKENNVVTGFKYGSYSKITYNTFDESADNSAYFLEKPFTDAVLMVVSAYELTANTVSNLVPIKPRNGSNNTDNDIYLYWTEDSSLTTSESGEISVTDGYKEIGAKTDGNAEITINFDQQAVNFASSGEDNTDFTITYKTADNYAVSSSTEISGVAEGNVSAQLTEDGILLTSDNENGLESITASVDVNSSTVNTVDCTSSSDSILITIGDDQSVSIKEDTDKDGDFETNIGYSESSISSQGTCGDNISWTLDKEGILTVYGFGDMGVFSTEDPAPWANYKDSIQKIVVSDDITSIGDYAFSGCGNAISVDIPSSIKNINDYAFSSCSSLTKVYFAGDQDNWSVITIGTGNTDLTGATLICKLGKVDISDVNVTGIVDMTYTGEAITQTPVVTVDDKILVQDTDYTVSYANNTNIGTATVTITGKGNYTGTVSKTFTISAASIANATVSGISNKTYTGSALTQNPTVKVGDQTLTKDTDYTVSYANNTKVGTATVKITGKGNYTGTVSKTFKINGIPVFNATVSGISNKTYTGSAITQNPTVKVGDNTLTKNTDYTVSYANNTKVGTATVKITGKGNYTGTISKTFKISRRSIAKATISGIVNKTYTGSAKTQNPTVKVGDKTLKKGTDYTVSYANNINVGTATVTITGKGNYASKKTATFKINKAAQSITAKAGTSRVAVGKTTTVSITGNKGKKSYKSSNTAIAKVTSAGKVTAKKVGTVKITATSAATANYKAASKTVTIKVVPAATASLAAANQPTGIKLTWKRVTGANGYKVYRGSTLIKTITSGSTVSFVDKKANTNGTKYTYKVVARATTGDSTLSKSWVIYRVSRPAVSSVTNSAASKMTVKWGKNAKANGYQIQYSLSSSFASGNKAVTVASASTVSKVIGSLTKGKTYYVRIRTYKTVGSAKYWSEWSAKKSVKISK